MAAVYVSPSGTFTFEYPESWKLERESGGAIALRKKGALFKKDSQYSLRIKPLLSDQIISPEAYAAFVNFRKKEHRNLEIIEKSDLHVMNFHIIKYHEESYQDFEDRTLPVIQDFWELVINNRIFTCIFTVIKGEEDSPKAVEEKATAEQILQSIKLL
jgi:hypothetical protein